MKTKRCNLFLLCFFTIVAVQPLTAAKGDKYGVPEINPGETVQGKVEISLDYSSYNTYTLRVPPDAFAIRLIISESPADLDIFIKKGEEIQSYKDVDASSEKEDYNEVLFLTRFSNPSLESGRYFVDVTYQRSSLPDVGGKRIRTIPYALTYQVLRAESSGTLVPGKMYSSELKPEAGMFQVLEVVVPPRSEGFRVDVFNAPGDLDLFVSRGKIPLSYEEADYIGESLLGNEQLMIKAETPGPLPEGRYYILVIDQLAENRPGPFSLLVSFSDAPPAALLKVPYLPDGLTDLEQAIMATVEVIAEAGKGSGCLVSPRGLVLTNWHVVEGFSGDVSENIYIAMSFSLDEPPRELFKAELLESDPSRDFALLKITGGLYGQALPRAYTFPYFRLGDPEEVEIGQPVSIIGFPSIGGTGSRVSVSLTRGIISGFEKDIFGTLLKTDAKIISGNSGGAACNVYYELLGLPTIVISEETGNMGFIYPVSMLPASWFDLIGSFR
ncbi:MAG: trypsin-like peptidase domain-containing protein [Spirochaetales bacterium]|nr:trypsin-like peptidase domain-containing protein [Spirochaetales bacterium]